MCVRTGNNINQWLKEVTIYIEAVNEGSMYSKWLLLYMLAQVYLTNWQWLSVVCNLSKTIFVVTVVTRQSEASPQQISTSPQYRHRIKRSSCVTIAWHVDASNFVCTLVNNGKLANQIAILPPVVYKYIKNFYREHLLTQTLILRLEY